MNELAREIIHMFVSQQNRELCKRKVRSIIGPDADVFLRSDFDKIHLNYGTIIAREVSLSDPMPGTEIRDHVNSFNHQFVQSMIDFMHAHVLCEDVPIYSIGDGLPTSRAMCNKQPRQLLDEWKDAPGRQTQIREDPSADAHPHTYGIGNEYPHSGITFCDQSRMNTSHHADQFYSHTYLNSLNDTVPYAQQFVPYHNRSHPTPTGQHYITANSIPNQHPAAHNFGVENYDVGPSATKLGPQPHMRYRTNNQSNNFNSGMTESPLGNLVPMMTQGPGCHTNYAFGNATKESDERLLSRRIFRSAHADCENGIPRYEQRLQRRNMDRDIEENIRPIEHDYKLYGHDMTSLYARINYKNNYNTQFLRK